MSYDIAGFASEVQIIGSNTFPAGFTVTEFPGDTDPVDIPSIAIADKEMGVNGDLTTWTKATPVDVTVSVISGSDSDINLGILAEANRAARGKSSARDKITMTVIYPDGRTTTLKQGVMTNATISDSVSSAGKLKTKIYVFTFESVTRTL